MAILLNYNDKRFGDLKECYCKLIHIHGNPDQIYYSFQIYKDYNKAHERDKKNLKGVRLKNYEDPYIAVINDSFAPLLETDENIFVQAYNDMKIKYDNKILSDI